MYDLWSDFNTRTKSSVLLDFDRKARPIGSEWFSNGRVFGQAEAIIKIERFVDAVLRSSKPAYIFTGQYGEVANETPIGRKLRELLPLAWMFGSNHAYSERPQAFLRACWLVDRVYGFSLSRTARNVVQIDARHYESMNTILDTIRQCAREDWYLRCVHDRRYEASSKAKTLASYTGDVLKYYSKTLVVRLDLGYLEGASSVATVDRVLNNLHDLLGCRDFHPFFKHLVGYSWAVEQGDKKGFHIHLALFFNGSAVRQDITIGDLIGEQLWRQHITRGLGTYYNCNKHKEKYERLGIGMIHRNNEEECQNAIACLQYLSKGGVFIDRDDQYLRVRPIGARTFGTGQAPDLEKKRGRPPLQKMKDLEGAESHASAGVIDDAEDI